MIRKWAKLLPYGLVMFFAKKFNFNSDYLEFKHLGQCHGFRIDKGEWVIFSKDNYTKMREQELKHRQTRIEKKKEKIQKMLREDCGLKQSLKEDLDYEEKREMEQFEY